MKKFLITGASSGIGLRLTTDLLRAEQSLFGTYYSNSKPLEYLQKKFQNLSIAKLELENVKFPDIQELDVLILNAGIICNNLLLNESVEDFKKALNANLKASFLLCKKYISVLRKSNNAHIIFISSGSGVKGNAGQISYSASKAALIGFAKSLAREVAPMNIKVNTILPGFLKTKQTLALSTEIHSKYKEENLLKRTNNLGEISKFIIHLTESKNISGQVFNLDSRVY